MRLILVRHGQTEWNRLGRAQGHSDIPLDDTGREQAAALARRFADQSPVRVVSSDLQRARATAEAVAHLWNQPVEIDGRLRERSFGDWEGRSFTEIRIMLGDRYHLDAPPGGESYAMVWARLTPFAQELFDRGDSTLIVTHGGTAALLLAQLLGGTPDLSRAFRFGNTAVTELKRREDGSWVLERYNDDSHLSQPARQGDLSGSR